MIEAENITKTFEGFPALKEITATIKRGSVFGLVGTNGAGKSTFLRVMAGILRPDHGSLTIEGQPVYENPGVKARCFYISDEQYFFNNCTPEEISQYYAGLYPHYDQERFAHLLQNFELPAKRKINTFSKGMKKQVSVLCALSSGCDYLFCDETFDGLDPVIRQGVKSLFAADVAQRQLTPIIASHNLRELEDICDHVGLLHKGGILFSQDLDDMKLNIHKVQAVLKQEITADELPTLEILSLERRGKLHTIIARGSEEELLQALQAVNPIFMEVLPLTLEEIFISETEVKGYDIHKLLV